MKELSLSIIYEDESLVICNKPSGLLSIKDGYDPSLPSAHSLLNDRFGRLWIVHRLDKETSGLLIFARTASAHRHLNTQMEGREVKKHYHALTHGAPDWKSKNISLPLRVNGDRSHRTVVDHTRGKPAFTSATLLATNGRHSYLDVTLGSGYTHQIRAHLSFLGLPVIHDELYIEYARRMNPAFSISNGLESTVNIFGLHAYSLAFLHPSNQRMLNITIPDPQSFIQFAEKLPVQGK